MKLSIYAIRDVHTGFLTPTVDQNDNSAMRNFAHAMKNPQSLFNSHPEDFTLFKIGSFDTESGEIVSQLPETVIDGYLLK